MEKLIEYLSKEGRLVLQAPAVFLIAVVLCAVVIWTAMGWAYSARFEGQAASLSSLEDRLKLKDEKIASYKEKLSGATPEEARSRIDALELQIKALSPRRVSLEQRHLIVRALAGSIGVVSIVQDMAAADAKPLAADLAVAFQSANWQVRLPMVVGPSNVPATGLALRVRDPNALRPIEHNVRAALQAAGLDFELQGGLRTLRPEPPRPSGFPATTREPEPDVELLLTTRAS